MGPRPCCLPSAGHNEPTFPQATLSSDGMLVTALLATVWHTSVAKKISRCSDGVARGKSCTAWRARSFHAVLQGAPPAISASTQGKGHFIAGPNGCKLVAHTRTPDPLCSFLQHPVRAWYAQYSQTKLSHATLSLGTPDNAQAACPPPCFFPITAKCVACGRRSSSRHA